LQCGNEVEKDTVDEVVEAVLGLGEGTILLGSEIIELAAGGSVKVFGGEAV
jgi:hypothetical protein